MDKRKENMWCQNCEHEWETDNYLECIQCPNCKFDPPRIMRTSSISYVYAIMEKIINHTQEVRDKQINKIIE